LCAGNPVLVHCNEGRSRAAGIGLLYLVAYTDVLKGLDFYRAETTFRTIYSPYNPKAGMRGYMTKKWDLYAERI
jgi:protein-tyrosine phosphatase